MSSLKNIGLLVLLCYLFAVSLCQVSQGGPHETQSGPQESQGGPNKAQVGPDDAQVGLHVIQGGPHEAQGWLQKSQRVPHVIQGGPHKSQLVPHVSQEGPQESQAGPHVIQGRVRRQTPQAQVDWVSCDFTVPSKISCHDCNTRVICKPVGGILKPCTLKKPYCNNGLCSAVPSDKCV